ncbi:MAG: short-chain fatty acid transporter [Leptospiraceae bacterium]|nr:short-chain fatty acid transporter [Leptospiraceae bacterium]MBL0265771.1 short-chain fatty acid transporter [Leptospiraceae bacterium]
MLRKISNLFTRIIGEYLPDPFILAILISFLVLIAGAFNGNSPMEMAYFFGKGFFSLNSFTMQMLLVLVTGHILANTKASHKGISYIIQRIETPTAAILVTALVSIFISWINWGFGLIAGAVLAKEVAKKVREVDYRLLIASAYSGFVVWHGGLSGSIPLTIATDKHFAMQWMGVVPIRETLFSPLNLFILATLILGLPFINLFMHPKLEDRVLFKSEEEELLQEEKNPNTFAEKLEHSKWISISVSLVGFFYITIYFLSSGFKLNLDIVNFSLLFLGILLHLTPIRFLEAAKLAVKGTSGIILQFPFYAGIMGMMVDSGLAKNISNLFVEISNPTTFPLFTFWSAGILNLFIPSGGGQWAVQGPIVLAASRELGVSYSKIAMAVAWGDAWTNLIQPFWALPALAVAGLGIRDIMGFCLVSLIFSGVVISIAFLVF